MDLQNDVSMGHFMVPEVSACHVTILRCPEIGARGVPELP